MITEHDLHEAIAECQGQRNPNANTCIKLAAYYIILEHLEQKDEGYSYSAPPMPTVSRYTSDTEFGRAVEGKDIDELLPLIDEIMSALSVIQPRMYDAVMRKLE